MSNENLIKNFIHFLYDKNPKGIKCPICQAVIIPNNDGYIYSMSKKELSLSNANGSNDFFTMSCDSCGYTLNFNLEKVDVIVPSDKYVKEQNEVNLK